MLTPSVDGGSGRARIHHPCHGAVNRVEEKLSNVADPVGVVLVRATRPSATDSITEAEVSPDRVVAAAAPTFRDAEPATADDQSTRIVTVPVALPQPV